MFAPRLRISRPSAAPTRSISSRFQVLAMDNATGNIVLPMDMCPCGVSSEKSSGMPKRVFSFACFCSALVTRGLSAGCNPFSKVVPDQGSERSTP